MNEPLTREVFNEFKQAFSDNIAEIRKDIKEANERWMKELYSLRVILIGNGAEGIVNKVRSMDDRLDRIERAAAVIRLTAWQLMVKIIPWAIAGLAAGAAGGWTFGRGN